MLRSISSLSLPVSDVSTVHPIIIHHLNMIGENKKAVSLAEDFHPHLNQK